MLKTYGLKRGEFHYSKMPNKIIIEKYLTEPQGAVKDYKFYCFHGSIAFLSVEEGKIEGTNFVDYFNTNWERHPVEFYDDYPKPSEPFIKPANFEQMIRLAETLSRGYPHIRVDLYNINGKVYFGELTYTPESGITQWVPTSLDFEYGKLMDINNISH